MTNILVLIVSIIVFCPDRTNRNEIRLIIILKETAKKIFCCIKKKEKDEEREREREREREIHRIKISYNFMSAKV